MSLDEYTVEQLINELLGREFPVIIIVGQHQREDYTRFASINDCRDKNPFINDDSQSKFIDLRLESNIEPIMLHDLIHQISASINE